MVLPAWVGVRAAHCSVRRADHPGQAGFEDEDEFDVTAPPSRTGGRGMVTGGLDAMAHAVATIGRTQACDGGSMSWAFPT